MSSRTRPRAGVDHDGRIRRRWRHRRGNRRRGRSSLRRLAEGETLVVFLGPKKASLIQADRITGVAAPDGDYRRSSPVDLEGRRGVSHVILPWPRRSRRRDAAGPPHGTTHQFRHRLHRNLGRDAMPEVEHVRTVPRIHGISPRLMRITSIGAMSTADQPPCSGATRRGVGARPRPDPPVGVDRIGSALPSAPGVHRFHCRRG